MCSRMKGVVVIGVGVESGGFIVLRVCLEWYQRLSWGILYVHR